MGKQMTDFVPLNDVAHLKRLRCYEKLPNTPTDCQAQLRGTRSTRPTQKQDVVHSGPDPIKIFSASNYAMLVFKHSDWLLQNFNQKECSKICEGKFFAQNLFIGSALDPVLSTK